MASSHALTFLITSLSTFLLAHPSSLKSLLPVFPQISLIQSFCPITIFLVLIAIVLNNIFLVGAIFLFTPVLREMLQLQLYLNLSNYELYFNSVWVFIMWWVAFFCSITFNSEIIMITLRNNEENTSSLISTHFHEELVSPSSGIEVGCQSYKGLTHDYM